MNRHTTTSAITKAELSAAIQSGQLHHVFQPIVDVRERTISGVEALLRWDHPTMGSITPDRLLPAVHSFDLWTELTDLTLRNATEASARLRRVHGPDVTVAVNLSSQQLQDPATAMLFAQVSSSDPGLARTLAVEVVEDLSWVDLALGAATVEALRGSGIRVFLDDFGTGAGTLSMLTELSYDGLKIDRHFISRVTTPGPARAVVEAIIGYAQSADIQLVAEGVEDQVTLQTLAGLGCHLIQGYAVGRPQLLADLMAQPAHEPARSDASAASSKNRATSLRARIVTEVEFVAEAQFDVLMARVARLEADAKRLDLPERDEVLLEIGERATLAAIYAGDNYLGIEWGMQASRIADSLGLPGRSAASLSLVATLFPSADQDRVTAARALAQTLHLRMAHSFEPTEQVTVDNNLGALLANMGLVVEAIPWWRSALETGEEADCRSAAIAGINLADIGMDCLEGDSEGPRELSEAGWRELVVRAIAVLHASAFSPPGTAAAASARYAIHQGDLETAAQHLASIDDSSLTNLISRFAVTRCRALLASARGERQTFVTETTHLIELMSNGPPVETHRDRAEQLHAKALVASGQHIEAATFLTDCLQRQRRHSSQNHRALFEWLQTGVQMDRRYSAVHDFLNADGRGSSPPL